MTNKTETTEIIHGNEHVEAFVLAPSTIETIVGHFGQVAQIRKTIEELTELSLVIQHWLDKKATAGDVVEEIADVLIVAQQMRAIFGVVDVDETVALKIDRTLSMIPKRVGGTK
jgi:hypothetical protein